MWSLVILILVIVASSCKYAFGFSFIVSSPLVKFLYFISLITLTILILKSVHDNWVPELIINIILSSVVLHNLFCQVVLAHCISSYFCYYNCFTTFNFKIIAHIEENCKNATLMYTHYWASPNVNILHKHSTFLTSNISMFLFIVLFIANLVKQINKMIGPTLRELIDKQYFDIFF